MGTPDPFNIKETDPEQLIYVSKKNNYFKKVGSVCIISYYIV